MTTISLITGGTEGGSHPRIARWLGLGFERLGVSFDAVHVERPRGVEVNGTTRVVRLGSKRLRWAAPSVAHYLRSAKPELVLATPIEMAVMSLGVARLTEARVIPWEQTMARSHVRDHATRFRSLPALERLTYPTAVMIAATSQDVRADLLEHLGARLSPQQVAILPNPIDAEEIRHRASPRAQRTSRFRICAIGRLASQKGYDVLLEAMALAAPQMERDWELLIIGGGPLRDDLEHRAMRLGVSERVRFVGFLDNPYPLLASSDVFVHTARWEGFGLVIAEAMALGIPVIATSCPGGPSEILGNGRYGILAPPEHPESIAEALMRAASDEALLADLSERGVRRVAEYEPEVVAATAINLLKELR